MAGYDIFHFSTNWFCLEFFPCISKFRIFSRSSSCSVENNGNDDWRIWLYQHILGRRRCKTYLFFFHRWWINILFVIKLYNTLFLVFYYWYITNYFSALYYIMQYYIDESDSRLLYTNINNILIIQLDILINCLKVLLLMILNCYKK